MREDTELERTDEGRVDVGIVCTHCCWNGGGGADALEGTENIHRDLI